MPKQSSFRWVRGQSIGLYGELAHLDVTKYLSLQRRLVMKLSEEVSAGHRLAEAELCKLSMPSAHSRKHLSSSSSHEHPGHLEHLW